MYRGKKSNCLPLFFFPLFFSSPYLFGSLHLLFVETGIAGLLILAFPMVVTSDFMAVAAAYFGLFLGHVIVTVFSSHQLHKCVALFELSDT